MGKGRSGGGAAGGGTLAHERARTPIQAGITGGMRQYDGGNELTDNTGARVDVTDLSRMDTATLAAQANRAEKRFRNAPNTITDRRYNELAMDAAKHRRALYLRGLTAVERVGLPVLMADGARRFTPGTNAALFQYFTAIGHSMRLGYRNRVEDWPDRSAPGRTHMLSVLNRAINAKKKYPGPNEHAPNPYLRGL